MKLARVARSGKAETVTPPSNETAEQTGCSNPTRALNLGLGLRLTVRVGVRVGVRVRVRAGAEKAHERFMQR